MPSRPRAVAVDWSGAASGAERSIYLAEVKDGLVVTLESGRNRESLTTHLIELANRDENVVVGLDFAFSLPAWFLDEHTLTSAPELWELVEHEGERWLRECESPFWGRPGRVRPELPAHFRRSETEVATINGIRPKSVFQIGGAGAVGTGSLRGMPSLLRLRRAGFSIWPFDPPRLPLVVEIYPRLLTGQVTKSAEANRRLFLDQRAPELEASVRAKATGSEDAFDALVSALEMDARIEELCALPPARDSQDLKEGRIWEPLVLPAHPEPRANVEIPPPTPGLPSAVVYLEEAITAAERDLKAATPRGQFFEMATLATNLVDFRVGIAKSTPGSGLSHGDSIHELELALIAKYVRDTALQLPSDPHSWPPLVRFTVEFILMERAIDRLQDAKDRYMDLRAALIDRPLPRGISDMLEEVVNLYLWKFDGPAIAAACTCFEQAARDAAIALGVMTEAQVRHERPSAEYLRRILERTGILEQSAEELKFLIRTRNDLLHAPSSGGGVLVSAAASRRCIAALEGALRELRHAWPAGFVMKGEPEAEQGERS